MVKRLQSQNSHALSSAEMGAMKPPLTCTWSQSALTESCVIWPGIPFQPCEVGQVLMPHPRAVKNPEAEQGAWHTLFSKLTRPHCRPQPPVLTAHIVLSATAVILVSAWGPGKWLAMRIAAFVSQKVGLGHGGPCLGMREGDTADQTAAPRLPDRGHLDMQGLEWTRSGVTSGLRCRWPRGPPGGEGSHGGSVSGSPRASFNSSRDRGLVQDSPSPLLPSTAQAGGLSLDPERSQGLIAGTPGSQSPGHGGGSPPGRGRRRGGALPGIPPPPNPALPRYLAKLSSVGSISEEETCEKLKGLIQRQVQMCKRNLEVMDSVRRGAQLAIEECQYQFRNRRWNCSTLDSLPVFGKVVTQGEGGARGGAVSSGGGKGSHVLRSGLTGPSLITGGPGVSRTQRRRGLEAGGPSFTDTVVQYSRQHLQSWGHHPVSLRIQDSGRGKNGAAWSSSEGEQQNQKSDPGPPALQPTLFLP